MLSFSDKSSAAYNEEYIKINLALRVRKKSETAKISEKIFTLLSGKKNSEAIWPTSNRCSTAYRGTDLLYYRGNINFDDSSRKRLFVPSMRRFTEFFFFVCFHFYWLGCIRSRIKGKKIPSACILSFLRLTYGLNGKTWTPGYLGKQCGPARLSCNIFLSHMIGGWITQVSTKSHHTIALFTRRIRHYLIRLRLSNDTNTT